MTNTGNPGKSLAMEDGRLSAESLAVLGQNADMLECRCPTKLIEILHVIRAFTAYTDECIAKYPQDAKTHQWLRGAGANLDRLVGNTLVQLARMEGYIDGAGEFCSPPPAGGGKG